MPTIHLDPDLAEKLRLRAVAQGRSLTNLSNLLLRRLLGMKATPNNGRTVISKK
jgi:plasmid stability protein